MTTEPIFIPQPADWISLNERTHWRAKSTKTKAWRKAAEDAAEHHMKVHAHPVDILCEVHKPSRGPNRRWDPHNLFPTMKACIDGLVDAYVLADDDTKHVHNVAIIDGGRRDTPGVTITIKEHTESDHLRYFVFNRKTKDVRVSVTNYADAHQSIRAMSEQGHEEAPDLAITTNIDWPQEVHA